LAGAPDIIHALQRFAFATAILVSATATLRAEPILPTDNGATWEYEVRDPSKSPEPAPLTVRINGTEEVGARELLKLETLAEDVVTKTELVSVDERGVHCHQRAGADGKATILDPPQTIVPAPLKIDATWEVNDHVAGGGTQQFKVVAQEDVTVPAGKFRAFRLRCEQPWPISTTTERWFAPGTGMVADVTTTRGPNGRLLSRATTMLKKFSVIPPPKDTSLPSITIDAATPPRPAATPTAAPNPAILLEVTGARDGSPQTEFKSDARQIFVRWSGVNLPVGESVRVAWIAEDVGDLADPNFIIDEMDTTVETAEFGARFTLSRPTDGWAAGKYRVELYLGDELLQKLNVTITD
jgi:hypothetical protein